MRHLLVAGVVFVAVALLTAAVLRDDALASVSDDAVEDAALTFDLARATGVMRPAWQTGDAWVVEVEGGSMWLWTGAPWTCTVGVAEAGLTAYRMGSSCPALAARFVLDPQLPFARIGPDLDALQDEAAIEFFQWPLQAGRTWSTTWGGEELWVSAKYEPAVEGPLGKEPGFLLEMVDASGARVASYNYAPSLRWWSSFEMAGLRLTVVGHGHGSDEALLTATAEEAFAFGGVTGVGGAGNSFELEADVDLVYIHHAMRGAHAQYVSVDSPAGSVYSCLCSTNPSFGAPLAGLLPQEAWEHASVVPAVAGTWSVDAPGAGTGQAMLTLHAIRLTEHTW